MEFTLFLEAGDRRNAEVCMRMETVFGKNFEAVTCPPGTSDWYTMPFIRDANGTTYFGIDAIQQLVDQFSRGVAHCTEITLRATQGGLGLHS